MKTNTADIQDLSKELGKLLKLIHEESDMACVLIATSYLDQALAALLEGFFIKSQTTKNLLKSDRGALGNLQSRADVSYCLGLIPKGLYQNLCGVGEIRNKFAHSYLSLSMDDPEIAEIVGSLTFPVVKEVVGTAGRRYNVDYFSAEVTHPGQRFRLVVDMMAARLVLSALSARRRCRKSSGWA